MPKYHARWAEMDQTVDNPAISTREGATFRGVKIQSGYYRFPAGTGGKLHSHPEEQIVCVLKGRLHYQVGDEEGIAEPGDLLYMPSNVPHGVLALDEDVHIIASRDVL